ncbi:MAG: very short patch repair endonuclease [Terriglobales bacterium]
MDTISSARRSENMRRIKDKGTHPEMIVRSAVHRMGYRYRLHARDLPGRPDLVFPARKKIIEVRGCFWHQHVGCNEAHVPKTRIHYWRPKLTSNRKRDNKNVERLRALGWKVLVVWECEITDTKQLLRQLRRFLQH